MVAANCENPIGGSVVLWLTSVCLREHVCVSHQHCCAPQCKINGSEYQTQWSLGKDNVNYINANEGVKAKIVWTELFQSSHCNLVFFWFSLPPDHWTMGLDNKVCTHLRKKDSQSDRFSVRKSLRPAFKNKQTRKDTDMTMLQTFIYRYAAIHMCIKYKGQQIRRWWTMV